MVTSIRGLLWSHHSDGIAGQQRRHIQHHVVRHVGQQVDDGHDGHGDGDGQGQIPTETVETGQNSPTKVRDQRNQPEQDWKEANMCVCVCYLSGFWISSVTKLSVSQPE